MSDALAIRDAAYDVLVAALTINGNPIPFTRKQPILKYQISQLPCLSVFIIAEKGVQVGGTGVGGGVKLIKFDTAMELGVSLVVMSSDTGLIDDSLDEFADGVKNLLFEDFSFLGLFDYVTDCSREYAYPRDGESYMAECRMRITFTYRPEYQAPATVPLKLVDIQTVPPDGTPIIEIQIPLEGG